jgi:hypothetical protein
MMVGALAATLDVGTRLHKRRDPEELGLSQLCRVGPGPALFCLSLGLCHVEEKGTSI